MEEDGAEVGGREARFRFVRARCPDTAAAAATAPLAHHGTFPRRPQPPPPAPPHGFLSALESEVQFPAVHWSWGYDFDAKDPMDAWEAKNDVTVLEGRYREVRGIQPAGAPEREAWAWSRAAGPDAGCAYLLLGFGSRAPPAGGAGAAALAHALLATWRDWSGARHLYLHLPHELRLARVALLQRVDPPTPTPTPPAAKWRTNGLLNGSHALHNGINGGDTKGGGANGALERPQPPFQFLVLAACRCANSPLLQARLLDFAQRLRAQRVSAAYVSVYSAQTARSIATL